MSAAADDPLLVAIGKVLKSQLRKRDTEIAALEGRVASLERQLDLAKRIEHLEAEVQSSRSVPRLRAAGGA